MAVDRQSLFNRAVNTFFIVSALVNCIIIFIFERDRKPKIERLEMTVTTNHVIVVTNYLSSVSRDAVPAAASSNLLEDLVRPRFRVDFPYQYMVHGDRQYARVDDIEMLSVGSPTSYGRVKAIYPDRIQLDNGVWLFNPRRSSGSRRGSDTSSFGSLALKANEGKGDHDGI